MSAPVTAPPAAEPPMMSALFLPERVVVTTRVRRTVRGRAAGTARAGTVAAVAAGTTGDGATGGCTAVCAGRALGGTDDEDELREVARATPPTHRAARAPTAKAGLTGLMSPPCGPKSVRRTSGASDVPPQAAAALIPTRSI